MTDRDAYVAIVDGVRTKMGACGECPRGQCDGCDSCDAMVEANYRRRRAPLPHPGSTGSRSKP